MMRKLLFPLAILLIVGGFLGWRALRPPLSDEEQIAAHLEAICAAASARRPRGVADFLAKDFKAGDMTKSEFQNSLAGGFLQFRVVDLKVSGVKNQISGDDAESNGNFALSLKPEFTSPPQIQGGKFQLKWRQIDGEWKVIAADVPNLPQITG